MQLIVFLKYLLNKIKSLKLWCLFADLLSMNELMSLKIEKLKWMK